MNQIFSSLIDALSAKVGVKLEISDECRLLCDFDDFSLLIEYLEGGEQILLAVPVGSPPKSGREAFYLKLLQGQYLFHETGGATLALDMLAQFVNLQVVRHIRTLEVPDFLALVEDFLNLAAYWRERCAAAAEAEAEEVASGVPQSGSGPDALTVTTMLRC